MTKTELLTDINRAWDALQAGLGHLSLSQLTEIKDAHGWTVKDHVTHMTAWERSVVFFLQGKPRHEGLGVTQAIYATGDDDTINAAVQKQHQAQSWPDVLNEFRAVHGQLLKLIEPLSDADLQLTYRHYLPNEPGEGAGPTAFKVIFGNTANHYTEHQDWIESLVTP